MLEVWINKCSPHLAKSIIELFRMLFRSGLNDFYYWCLPLLNQLIIGYGMLSNNVQSQDMMQTIPQSSGSNQAAVAMEEIA